MQTSLGSPTISAVAFFLLIVALTLAVTYWASRRTRSTSEFYAAGRSISPLQNGLARARIDGRVRLKHSFSPGGGAEDYADSELLGFVDFDMSKRAVQRLRLVTTKAIYAGTEFRASLVSMSRETLDALGK